jgi:hypothetical protein
MNTQMGGCLQEYERRVRALRDMGRELEGLDEYLFAGFEDWERLLLLKLAPRMAGEGCLTVAVVGGTNTGKSTIFNSILGTDLSPMSPYGAHTRHPIAAANADRYEQCLERGKLLPDAFIPKPLEQHGPGAVADTFQEPMSLFVALREELPDSLVLLDTPDIDSVIRHNWELAKSIREAGDVLIGVLTAQKYADSLVVEFFREAQRSGRRIVPLMNFADDHSDGGDYAVARKQLEEFEAFLDPDIEIGPAFVMPRRQRGETGQPVALDDPALSLWEYVQSLDAVTLKQQILQDSLERFSGGAEAFQSRLEQVFGEISSSTKYFDTLAHHAAAAYEPKPGREVVTVVYDYMQDHASAPDRIFGAMTAQAVKVPRLAVTATRSLLRKKLASPVTEQDLGVEQRRQLTDIANRLYSEYLTHGLSYLQERAPFVVDHVEAGLRAMEPSAAAEAVAAQVIGSDDYMEAYRQYAYEELDQRWHDRTFRWTVKNFYRLGLLGSWAGVLVLLWSHGWAPGLPLSEILASLGVPIFQHTVTHAALYLWGDKLAGLVRRWQALQRDELEEALCAHITWPALGVLRPLLGQLAEHVEAVKELNEKCLTAR